MLRQEDCRLLVAEMLEAMTQSLRRGRRIEIRGFGVFSLRHRTARLVLNPRTLERLPVAAKAVPFFRAGKCLQARVLDPVSTTDGH